MFIFKNLGMVIKQNVYDKENEVRTCTVCKYTASMYINHNMFT